MGANHCMTLECLIAQLKEIGSELDHELVMNRSMRAPGPYYIYIERMFDAYEEDPTLLPVNDFLYAITPWLGEYIAILGATKDYQIFRDDQISRHVATHNKFLFKLHQMSEDYSTIAMTTWPKAYMGIDEPWAIPAKLCL